MIEENSYIKTGKRIGRKGFGIDYVALAKLYIETDEPLVSLAKNMENII